MSQAAAARLSLALLVLSGCFPLQETPAGSSQVRPAALRLLDSEELVDALRGSARGEAGSYRRLEVREWSPRGRVLGDDVGTYWTANPGVGIFEPLEGAVDTPWRARDANGAIPIVATAEEAGAARSRTLFRAPASTVGIEKQFNVADSPLRFRFPAVFPTTPIELTVSFPARGRVLGREPEVEVDLLVNGNLAQSFSVEALPAAAARKQAETLTARVPSPLPVNDLEIRFRNVGYDLDRGGIRAVVDTLRIGEPVGTLVLRDPVGGTDGEVGPVQLEVREVSESYAGALRWARRSARRHGRSFSPLSDPRFPVTLDIAENTTRSMRSFLLFPDASVGASVAIEPGATLRFGASAVPDEGAGADTVVVSLRDPDDGSVIASREIPLTGPPDAWRMAEIDLHALAGKRTEARLAFENPEETEGSRVLVIGEPVILTPGAESESRPPNVILVSLDTLRADHVGAYGYGRDTTPTVDRLAAEGVLFRNAFASSCWTTNSHQAMLSGYNPLLHTFFTKSFPRTRFAPALPSIADLFRIAGYRTAAFTGGGAVSAEQGFAEGFEFYDAYRRNFRLEGSGASERKVSVVGFDRAADWVRRNHETGPFFLFLHTYAIHGPYGAPAEYDALFPPQTPVDLPPFVDNAHLAQLDREYTYRSAVPPKETIDHIVSVYDRGIRYTDDQLGHFVGMLREEGVLDQTILVVTADHGEQFWEHGARGHGALYDEILRIPLVVRYPPGIEGDRRIDENVGLTDIVPTVSALAKVDVPAAYHGRNLVPLVEGAGSLEPRTLFMEYEDEYAVRSDEFKYILGREGKTRGGEELYLVDADPAEKEDVLKTGGPAPAAYERARSEMLRLVADSQPGLNLVVRGGSELDGATVTIDGFELDLESVAADGYLFSRDFPGIRIASGAAELTLDGRPTLISLAGSPGDLVRIGLEGHDDERPPTLGVGERAGRARNGGWRIPLRTTDLARRLFTASGAAARPVDLDLRWIDYGVDAVAGGADGAEFSDELNEQLRALGYLD